ncbi:double zinc ribbon and ankyrin repeat-containing protein 1 [Parambassis ranga]|uniref:Double zinc ribbon and ankyrin repeat-containing protein 1 n=1 Tax=Parambassis ranga TaxID=210632 RepID=A0A6P7JJD0_9TELE|nr:double zinc ribbon and ankyrin repeat-containing protein 1 [Parambassis ranga]
MAAGSVSAPLIIPIIHLQTHRAKNHIDTDTPVSIQSDTAGALILYTLDGSKPAAVPGAGQRALAGTSRRYSEPILLPAGRVCIRAVAVSSDGRESAVVTKVFSVELMSRQMEDSVQQHQSEETSCPAERSAGSSGMPAEQRIMGSSSPPSGPRFLNGRLGPGTASPPGSSGRLDSVVNRQTKQVKPCASPQGPAKLSSTQMTWLQRQTDFLRCAQCLQLRRSDPFARFCAHCGALNTPLPRQRLPPAEGGQMLLCVFCDSLVPMNTQTCLICEAAIERQLQPQASLTLQDHVVCVCCGSGNPAHVTSCLTCEARLHMVTTPTCFLSAVGSSAPTVRASHSRMLACSRCKRINSSDARYCDWCGSKHGHATSCVTCCRCGASGDPYASYCAACGIFLEGPAPSSSCSAITPPARGATTSHALDTNSHDASLKATPSSATLPPAKVPPPTVDQYTQTAGLYYPSATKLQKAAVQQVTRERRPLLTAISPGRGYWRKQLDHVCAHLRSYAQNNAPFRTLLGEPPLGRMVSAVIQEDQYEVSMTVSFVSARHQEKQVGPEEGRLGPVRETETLSGVTERSSDSSSESTLAEVSHQSDRGLTRRLPMPKSPVKVKDNQLLKELGPGLGQVSTIQELLDQGADPSCCGSDGRHALAVAVLNSHHDVLPVLVQRGADVDKQSGPMKNTALHEAAALGSAGLQCAEVLLSCKASVKQRNAAGQTAYDVAVASGCSSTVSLLATRTGQDLLTKLGRGRGTLDVF